ncbi:hypothetical protein [Myxococcus fulvus]|uniref:hypothetical protein n=1 Tax=Myxococcus fulvus TaxID=33 RepID=UPI0020BD9E5B|nr:hypothetical protein [Myxococcus fulvus]MCK8502662.1 hypothetical protein [Myxococcus fulvus]
MSSRRASYPWVVAVLLSFAFVAGAEPAEEQALACDEETGASLLTCGRARCGDDWVCAWNCPEALTAVCENNYCVYTYPDPGGGGGGGGPTPQVCPGMRCGGDWNCVCEGLQGTCGTNGYCTF